MASAFNLSKGIWIPSLIALVAFYLMARWFPNKKRGRSIIIWFIMAYSVFYLSGEIALQSVLFSNAPRVELIKITDYISKQDDIKRAFYLRESSETSSDKLSRLTKKYEEDTQ